MNKLVIAILSFLVLTIAIPLYAADGWYLLVPPRSNYNTKAAFLNGYKILDDQPLSKWGQQGAYDSAAECEAMKQTLIISEQNAYSASSTDYIKAGQADASQNVLAFKRAAVEELNADVLALMASRCINSNDPRLKRRSLEGKPRLK